MSQSQPITQVFLIAAVDQDGKYLGPLGAWIGSDENPALDDVAAYVAAHGLTVTGGEWETDFATRTKWVARTDRGAIHVDPVAIHPATDAGTGPQPPTEPPQG